MGKKHSKQGTKSCKDPEVEAGKGISKEANVSAVAYVRNDRR